MKPHELPGGTVVKCTDLRWYLATGEMATYARGRSVTMLVDAEGNEVKLPRRR